MQEGGPPAYGFRHVQKKSGGVNQVAPPTNSKLEGVVHFDPRLPSRNSKHPVVKTPLYGVGKGIQTVRYPG